MTAVDLLIWTRGPGFSIALASCVFGILLRLFEIYGLGRKTDLSPARETSSGSGWRTMLTRSLPPAGMTARAPVTYFGGYVFHIGLFVTVFLYIPHIELLRGLLGVSWPGLPTPVVDAVAVAGILGMLAVLASRLTDPVKRLISGFQDYFVWLLTLLPLLTGYLAYHHLWLEYTLMLSLHILSAETLIALLPFTKLFHAVSAFISRWYNGDISGRKGVVS
jgi:nitrate reductase gamma subunit